MNFDLNESYKKVKCPPCLSPKGNTGLSDIDRIKVFRKTLVEARYITSHVPVPNGSRVGVPYQLNDPSALAVRYLHVAIYRKYFASSTDTVFLPEVAKSLGVILGELGPRSLATKVKKEINVFKNQPFSEPAKLFLGDSVTGESAADVVFDYLYGALLHGDPEKVERSHNRGPVVATFAAQIWLTHAISLVDRLDRIVEFVLELEKVNFDPRLVEADCPDF